MDLNENFKEEESSFKSLREEHNILKKKAKLY